MLAWQTDNSIEQFSAELLKSPQVKAAAVQVERDEKKRSLPTHILNCIGILTAFEKNVMMSLVAVQRTYFFFVQNPFLRHHDFTTAFRLSQYQLGSMKFSDLVS